LAGLVLPTCECGVVPVVRRFLVRGVPAPAALAYMLAAPVINPVVLLSTWVAFPGRWWMVPARVALVVAPALLIALTIGRNPPRLLLKPQASALPGKPPLAACGHGPDCDCGHEHHQAAGPAMVRIMSIAAGEFVDMGRWLLVGCLASAALKTFLPFSWLSALGQNAFAAVGVMMLLAMLLSICSEADAFVASSFASFPWAAQLSFIAIGPMVDIKLAIVYSAVFHRLVVLALLTVPSLIIFSLSVMLTVLAGQP
jgi:uncharacterized membrane protein YraQ (UPF0718 family)